LEIIYSLAAAIDPLAHGDAMEIDFDFYRSLRKVIIENNMTTKFAHTKSLIKLIVGWLILGEADRLGPILDEIGEMIESAEAQIFVHEWLMLLLAEIKNGNVEARTQGRVGNF